MIYKYTIAHGGTVFQLIDNVNDLLARGWQPVGGVAVGSSPSLGSVSYNQALVYNQEDLKTAEAGRLVGIIQQAHDRLLRGDDDKEILDLLEMGWGDRPNV